MNDLECHSVDYIYKAFGTSKADSIQSYLLSKEEPLLKSLISEANKDSWKQFYEDNASEVEALINEYMLLDAELNYGKLRYTNELLNKLDRIKPSVRSEGKFQYKLAVKNLLTKNCDLDDEHDLTKKSVSDLIQKYALQEKALNVKVSEGKSYHTKYLNNLNLIDKRYHPIIEQIDIISKSNNVTKTKKASLFVSFLALVKCENIIEDGNEKKLTIEKAKEMTFLFESSINAIIDGINAKLTQ